MCLVVFAHEWHPMYRLVLAANRDEDYTRPTAPARFWPGNPGLLAGQDLSAGGTWMGVTRSGRVAAVTNLRGLRPHRWGLRSRGLLVRDFLTGRDSPDEFMSGLWARADGYNGFSLLVGDRSQLWFCSNGGAPPRRLDPGIYGLSNHLLDTPWPKVQKGKRTLSAMLAEGGRVSPERILSFLTDRDVPGDAHLPDTGVGVEAERRLAPIHVVTPDYGTRCSTVVMIERSGRLTFVERSNTTAGRPGETVEHTFPTQ